MIGKIEATGAYVPPRILDNRELSGMVETTDEWIQERTGIRARRIAEEDTAVSMAVKAAKTALESGKINPEELDLIIVSSVSSNAVLPCTACEVQKEIGAVNATCFDLNAACTGFLFAYNTAQSYIACGMYGTALVIGTEHLSSLTDWNDRGTCILFGDGAGAAILKSKEGSLYPMATCSDGTKGEALTYRNFKGAEDYIRMDGQAVFKFAVRRVPAVIKEVTEKAGKSVEEIDYFILHQANQRIIETVAKKLSVDIEKFPMNLSEYGNTSSASIPILLDEMHRDGKLKRGQKLVMAGFGAGLSWGAAYLEWQ